MNSYDTFGFENFDLGINKSLISDLIGETTFLKNNYNLTTEAMLPISKLLKKLTGLNFKFEFPSSGAYLITLFVPNVASLAPTVLDDNPGTSRVLSKLFDQTLGSGVVSKPFAFDPKKGVFVGEGVRHVVFTVGLGKALIRQFSPEEIAATILHEVGHARAFMYQLTSTLVANSYLTEGLIRVLDPASAERRKNINVESNVLSKLDKDKYPDLYKKISSGTYNSQDFFEASLKIAADEPVLQSLNQTNADTLYEQYADRYVVRAGLAAPLHRVVRSAGGLETVRSKKMLNLQRIAYLGIGAWLGSPLLFSGVLFFASVMTESSTLTRNEGYDRTYERCMKMLRGARAEAQTLLKDSSPQDVKATLDTIAYLEKEMAKYSDSGSLWEIVTLSYHRNRSAINFEERLSNLLNNPLFVSALRFKFLERK